MWVRKICDRYIAMIDSVNITVRMRLKKVSEKWGGLHITDRILQKSQHNVEEKAKWEDGQYSASGHPMTLS